MQSVIDPPQPRTGGQLPQNQSVNVSQTDGDHIDLVEMIRVLWHAKMLILTCMLLVAAIAGFYAFRIATPQYLASTNLTLEVRSQNVVNLDSIISGASTDETSINTELTVIKSRPLIEKLIADLDLMSDPEFNPDLREVSLNTKIKRFIRGLYGVEVADRVERTEEEIQLVVANNVSRAISTSGKRRTYIIDISATTMDPDKSARMVDRLAEIYFADQVANKFAATEVAIAFLSQRVQELEEELKSKEDDIEAVRAETELISPEALEALRTRSKEIRGRLSDAEANLMLAMARKQEFETLRDARDWVALTEAFEDPILRRLLPKVQSGDVSSQTAFEARLDARLLQISNEASRTELQISSFQVAQQEIENEIAQQNEDLVLLNQLAREAEATRALYETFLTRLKETSVQVGLQKADGRVLSQAVPGRLVAPRKTLIVAAGLALGALLGAGFALWQQMQNNGFRTSRELETSTGVVVMGKIPKISSRSRIGVMEYLRQKPTSAAAEAVRNLRTSIQMSNIDSPPKVIVSTSSLPGEGKTTQAIALANNFAAMNKRVLLVEGDIRRNVLKAYFKLDHKGGLVSVIMGERKIEEAIVRAENYDFDILMGGVLRGNAADLFSSERFAHLVEEFRSKYDYIIIDTPPVLLVPDARVIGQVADAIIYAVKWDKTHKTQVLEGQREFTSVGLKVTGFVLSQINVKGMKKYGYGGEYGAYAGYGKGYYQN